MCHPTVAGSPSCLQRSLTGYDNRDVGSGVRDEEVFLYDASADSGEGGVGVRFV